MSSSNLESSLETGNPRNKVSLKPGRSLMDWIRLTNSSSDLSGTGNQIRDVSLEELAQHNKSNDAWLAIRGLIDCHNNSSTLPSLNPHTNQLID